MSFSAEK